MMMRHMMWIVGVCVGLTTTQQAPAQAPPEPDVQRQQVFPSYEAFKEALQAITDNADPAARQAELDALWQTLLDANQAPYAQSDKVAFLYRGPADSVAWRGDFNNWEASPGTKLGETDLWMLELTLPADARVDYKIVLNDEQWVLDPANPLQMWSGFGPNSELRMPEYVFPHETIRRDEVPHGTLTDDITLDSAKLGYAVNYRVYTPAGYEKNELGHLPVVYVTDGHEFLADHLGAMVIVLDNLIADGRLRPTMAVFIDPRDPADAQSNRRMSQYVANQSFADFVADELVPIIDASYRTDAGDAGRTIMGTSLGGLSAAYFGAVKGDVFGNLAILSPAFGAAPPIYGIYRNQPLQFLNIYMTAGTIHDGDGGRAMAKVLDDGGYQFTFAEVNEGHSWGNWRGQLDDILIALVGPPGDG